jgi:hypothetical protein
LGIAAKVLEGSGQLRATGRLEPGEGLRQDAAATLLEDSAIDPAAIS